MSFPQPENRVVSLNRQPRPELERVTPQSRPRRTPEALLRISPEGTCLEAVPFDDFDALPPLSTLLGTDVRQALTGELGTLISSYVSQGPLRPMARELASGARRMSVELLPCRDGTSWVRLRDMPEVGQRAPYEAGSFQSSNRARTNRARFRLDNKGRITSWSAGAALMTGLTADAVGGLSFSDLASGDPTWRDRVEATFPLGADGRGTFKAWLWRRDATRLYVSVSLKRCPGGYWVSLLDVTKRRLRDRRVATLYAVSGAALDAKSVGDLTRRTLAAMCEALEWEVGVFWQVDPSAGVVRCRQRVSLQGLPLSEAFPDLSNVTLSRGQGLAGKVWADGQADSAVDGFETHPVFGALPSVNDLRSGFAFPIQGSAGISGVFEFASRAVEVASAELIRTTTVISHHISQFADRLRAEQALRESDAQKAAILSTALDGLVTVDGAGHIVEFNAEAERTFGPATTVLGRSLVEFAVTSEDRAKLRTELTALAQRAADPDVHGRRIQVRAVRADGEEFPADLSITRIRLGGPAQFSICVRDLSERERLQDALHHSQKMESLGLLAGGIAHDFNNFLTVIRGQAERLVKNLPEADPRLRWVGSILKVSERASALTGQLLAFGRREAGTVAVVDLNAVVESTAGLLSEQFGDDITWETDLSPGAGPARVGEGQVQQILFNLALNARDAMSTVARCMWRPRVSTCPPRRLASCCCLRGRTCCSR